MTEANLLITQLLETAAEHQQAGRFAEAETLCRRILSRQADHPSALHMLGVIAVQIGSPEVGLELIERAAKIRPNIPGLYTNLAVALEKLGRWDDAVAAHRCAAGLEPNSAHARFSLATALIAAGRAQESIPIFRETLQIDADHGAAHFNLGNALLEASRFEEAIVEFEAATRLLPGFATAHNNLGNALRSAGRLGEAAAAYRRATELCPDDAMAWRNLGVVRQEEGDLDAAIAHYTHAVELQREDAAAWGNLGTALQVCGRLRESIEAIREVLRLVPSSPATVDGEEIHENAVASVQKAAIAESDVAQFHSNLILTLHLDPGYDSDAILRETRAWALRYAEPLKSSYRHRNHSDPDRPLRIGYVSGDFCNHVLGWNILSLLERHNRERFTIFCYSNGLTPDEVTARLRSVADRWREIPTLSDRQVADLISEDEIDILVDLSLHTTRNRLLVFARKPAPIQISYLAYCSTTGLNAMDYRFSDPYLDPPGNDLSCYQEETVRLPDSYWCYQPSGPCPDVANLPALASGCVTFGCLNNFAKVSPEALNLWMEILQVLPSSRLLLHVPTGSCREKVSQRFAAQGITLDRLEFVERQFWDNYLATLQRIDVVLDPFPYGGGITTCDALWMGVPVVSLSGQTAVGRGGRSILCNIGLPELVAETPEQYVKIALSLAGDLSRLGVIRSELRDRMERSPLRDAKGHAQKIESAYREMWRRWCCALR